MRTLNKELQEKITPRGALEMLKLGNERFVNNLKVNRNLLQQVNDTRDGQWPFAAIVSCMDSRTSAELVFDQGLGDIFSLRVAGNVINEDILGSLEYAVRVAGSKLIVVLGHTSCGAIKGACEHVELGHLPRLLAKIEPAIEDARNQAPQTDAASPEFVNKVAEANVKRTVKEILRQSSIIQELLDAGQVGIIGALYDVSSGKVSFYPDTFLAKAVAPEEELAMV